MVESTLGACVPNEARALQCTISILPYFPYTDLTASLGNANSRRQKLAALSHNSGKGTPLPDGVN